MASKDVFDKVLLACRQDVIIYKEDKVTSDLGKEEVFQFQTSQGMNRKSEYPGKNPLVGRRENLIDINLHESFTAIKALLISIFMR